MRRRLSLQERGRCILRVRRLRGRDRWQRVLPIHAVAEPVRLFLEPWNCRQQECGITLTFVTQTQTTQAEGVRKQAPGVLWRSATASNCKVMAFGSEYRNTAGRVTAIVFEESEGCFRVLIPPSTEPLPGHLPNSESAWKFFHEFYDSETGEPV